MKFTCDTCQARYQIPDEKVAGRKLKYVCRKCETAIILDGTTLDTAGVTPANPSMAPGPMSIVPMSIAPPAPDDAPATTTPATTAAAPPTTAAPAPTVAPKPAAAAPAASVAPKPAAIVAPKPVAAATPAPTVAPKPAAAAPAAVAARASTPPPARVSLPPPPKPTSTAPSTFIAKPPELPIWHVAIDGSPVGPMRLSEVRAHIERGAAHASSLAWRDGQDDWVPLGTIPALAALLAPEVAAPPARISAPPPARISAPPPARISAPPPPARISSPPPPERISAPPPATTSAPQGRESEEPPEVFVGLTPVAVSLPPPQRANTPEPPVVNAPVPTLAFDASTDAGPSHDELSSALGRRSGMGIGAILGITLGALIGGAVAFHFAQQRSAGNATAASGSTVAPTNTTGSAAQNGAASAITDNAMTDVGENDELVNALVGGPDAGPAPATRGSSTRGSSNRGSTGTTATPMPVGASLPPPEPTQATPRPAAPSGPELTAQQIRDVYRRNQGRVQSCYDRAATMVGNAPDARLQVAVRILPTGQVGRVTITGNDFGGLSACVQRVVQAWQFPASAQGGQTTFPFVFSGM